MRESASTAGDLVVVDSPPNWGLSDQYAKAFGFIPLSLSVLFFTCGCFAWGMYNIVSVSGANFQWDDVGDVVTGVFKLLIGLTGTAGVVFRWSNGMHFTNVAFHIMIVSQSVGLLTKWLEWSLAMGGVTTEGNLKWKPSRDDARYMTLYTVGVFSLLVVSFGFMVGWLKSVRRIYSVGGNGWERKNYLVIMREKYSLEASDELERYKEQYEKELLPPTTDGGPAPSNSPTSLSIMSFLLGNHQQDAGNRGDASHLQDSIQTIPPADARDIYPAGDQGKRGNGAFAAAQPVVVPPLLTTNNRPRKFRRWLSRTPSVQLPLTADPVAADPIVAAGTRPTQSPIKETPAENTVVYVKPRASRADAISGVSTMDDDDEISSKGISDWF